MIKEFSGPTIKFMMWNLKLILIHNSIMYSLLLDINRLGNYSNSQMSDLKIFSST